MNYYPKHCYAKQSSNHIRRCLPVYGKNGKRYSHIIDPRTGYGVTSQRNVTVIAKDGTTADWLATACSILPVKKAKNLATQLGAEVLITEIQKG